MFYNFSKFELIMNEFKTKGPSSTLLRQLKDELNKFFKDTTCKEVIFTNNTDKMFFGMCVLPELQKNDVTNILEGNPKRYTKYYLEIDSKLISPILGLTTKELVAILLHEVGHVINDTTASKEISKAANVYIARQGVSITYSDIDNSWNILSLGILRSLRKLTSIFERNDEEFIADEFVVKCGYGSELEKAYDKIISNRDKINDNDNKFVVLIWGISIFKDLSSRRKSVLKQLEESKYIEGSKLFIRRYDYIIGLLKKVINKIDDHVVRPDTEIYLKENGFIRKLKFSSLKSLEEDLYEFKIKINGIEDQEEAISILRSINMRISLIDEYLNTTEGLNQSEVERLSSLSNKYQSMRDDMVRKGSYDKGIYGLFIKYPEINTRYRV